MRFLADMGVSRSVVAWLRASGHDAVHLLDRGLERLADADVFALAVQESRILLTFDLDFGEIMAFGSGPTIGIILFPAARRSRASGSGAACSLSRRGLRGAPSRCRRGRGREPLAHPALALSRMLRHGRFALLTMP